MDTLEILKILNGMSVKTNNACLRMDLYYIINGLPIDKNYQ